VENKRFSTRETMLYLDRRYRIHAAQSIVSLNKE
jgi:hypothetical protein